MSLQRFVEDVYLDVKTRKWKASTRGTTEQLIEDHILQPLGNEMIHLVTRRQLQALLDGLAAESLSASVVGHVRFQLSAIFTMAEADRLVPVNPAIGLETPKCKPPGEKRVFSPDLFRRAEMCLEIRERLILLLAVVDGLRPGEIVGLKCGDISKDGVCHIVRRIYRRVVDSPKSKGKHRDVPLSEEMTLRVLQEYLSILPDRSPDAWLFPSENPECPIDYSNVFRRRIRPALSKVGLAWVNFQSMRRTSATELGQAEPDARVRADMMGHSVDVHENEYRQAPIEAKRRAKRSLEGRLQ
jgi:integrase